MYQEQITYPIEYDSIHKDCERAVYDLGMQLEHVKTFPPTLVREHKEDLIKTLLDHCDYLRSLS